MQRFVRAASVFVLLLSCTPADQMGPARRDIPDIARSSTTLPAVRFSEIHYDNTGTDAGEAIEVSGPAGTVLTGWQVVLYNGAGGASYNTQTLSGVIPATCGDRGVVVLNYPSNGIQNGSPDGLALVSDAGAVIEFLSYEGPFTATNGPASGMLSVDIGVSQNGTEPVGSSLRRSGAGVWTATSPLGTNTFGVCNDNDEPPPPPVASVAVSPATATVTTGGTQAFTATAFDASNQPIAATTFTWSTTTPAVATVNAGGVATAVAPGDAGIVATAPNGVAGTAALHVDEPPPPPGLPETRFSELHYDNVGTDAGEAIEIEGPAGVDLTGWSVVLYNGNGGVVYNTRSLTGTIPATCGARGVVVLTYPQDGIQNGSPDGLALVDKTAAVVEFLSYEGTLTAVDGPAAGLHSVDIIAVQSSAPIGQSLQRDAANQWTLTASSFGGCNGVEPPPPPGNTISFTGRLPSDPPLPVGFQDQLFATLRDPSNVVVATTFTWSSETPALATIDQNGVFTALGAGTAVLRATAAEGTTSTIALPTRVAVASTTALYAGNTEFGEPSDGDPSDDFIIRHDQYTASFNRTRGTPNWVSYDLEVTHFGPEDRCDCFTFDPALPAEFTRYTTADYTGAGAFHGYGIDRGHFARSFDRTSASLDNAYTYYFSNIVPQAADVNQGPWAQLENYLGDLAQHQNREVYIVAGVAGSKGTVKNEGKIVIPAITWKVALVMRRDEGLANVHGPQDLLEVIAVIMPNDPGVRNTPWQSFQTTVDAVEAASGYDVFAALPDWIERPIEANDRFPTASAGASYAGVEGSAIAFNGLGSSDPDGDALTYAWDFGDGATGTGPTPAHAYADNGTYGARLIVTDPVGAADTAEAVVVVANAPPVITALTTPAEPVAVGVAANIGVAFTDAGSGDTHTLTVDWGDGTINSALTHAYAAPGFYVVAVTVRDDDGGTDSETASAAIVVYNPSGGFVTGGGWFSTGGEKANFGFESRYGATGIARGNVELHVNARGFQFSSEAISYLVVTAGRATIRGSGVVGGDAVQFLLVATDGPDGIRLKVWRADGGIVFDNQPGASETTGSVTALGGGSITVH